LIGPASVFGQGGDEAEVKKAKQSVNEIWDTSTILRIAVNNLARRYNLNEEQKAYTSDMMTTRVNRFIEAHQEEVWPLMRDMLLFQQSGSAPDPETAKRIGPTALKIVEAAKGEIYSSNEEWREILTEEQKKVHDWDMREMRRTFEVMEGNLQSWASGTPSTGNIFPKPKPLSEQPRRPVKPNRRGTFHPKPAEDPDLDVQFQNYVDKFIKDYELKPAQIESARSILREIKQRASDFRSSRASEIREIKEKLRTAHAAKDRRVWNDRRRQLMRPINDLFAELTQRLDLIPDEAQLERHRLRENSGARKSATSSTKTKRAATAKADEPAPAPKAAAKTVDP
jgi:hypothetical protein